MVVRETKSSKLLNIEKNSLHKMFMSIIIISKCSGGIRWKKPQKTQNVSVGHRPCGRETQNEKVCVGSSVCGNVVRDGVCCSGCASYSGQYFHYWRGKEAFSLLVPPDYKGTIENGDVAETWQIGNVAVTATSTIGPSS